MNISFPTVQTALVPAGYYWGAYHPESYPAPTGRHMGLDLASYVGSPIYAPYAGRVDFISTYSQHGYGRHVVIQHLGFKTLYAHLHTIDVSLNQTLNAGDILGTMGGDPKDNDPIDGASSGSHLHWEYILPTQPNQDFIETFMGYTVNPIPNLMQYADTKPTHMGKVISSVYIRSGPNTTFPILGGLGANETINIESFVQSPPGTWAKLWSLRNEYACCKSGTQNLIVTTPIDIIPPPPPISEEKVIRRDEVEMMILFLQKRLQEIG